MINKRKYLNLIIDLKKLKIIDVYFFNIYLIPTDNNTEDELLNDSDSDSDENN